MADDASPDFTSLTAEVVSAYVSNNKVHSEELAKLISSTHEALKAAGQPVASEPQAPKPDKAAVKKSIGPEFLTSFIDGKKYKSLKRHLTTNGMTGADYRERYGLPKDYPMVAASYSAQRSALAKSAGLGRKVEAGGSGAGKAETEAPKTKGHASKPIKPQDETFT